MPIKIALVWVLGLVTAVPYGVYYLLFYAPRDQYALLITGILFWIFGFWGVVGPLIMAFKVRRVFKALEAAQSREKFEGVLRAQESEDVFIDLIAAENKIPKFLAKKLYRFALAKLAPAKDRPRAPKPG
jgi:hypothetical protein